MAAFKATFFTVDNRADTGSTMPTLDLGSAVRLTDLTTSASSQVVQSGGSDWAAPSDGYLRIWCDGAVNVVSAESPTAAATAGVYLPASTPYDFSIREGHKLAVIDA